MTSAVERERCWVMSDDPFYTLGPPAELFTDSEVTFTVTIKECLWPGHVPLTSDELESCLHRHMNPRTPTITAVPH